MQPLPGKSTLLLPVDLTKIDNAQFLKGRFNSTLDVPVGEPSVGHPLGGDEHNWLVVWFDNFVNIFKRGDTHGLMCLILDALCFGIPVIMFLAPVFAYWECFRKKKTLEMPPMSLSFQSLQCSIWVYYGLWKQDTLVWSVNVYGLAVGIIFLTLYAFFMDSKRFKTQYILQVIGFSTLSFGILAVIILSSRGYLPQINGDIIREGVGWTGTFFNILMFAHPVLVMVEVCKTGEVGLMGTTLMNVIGFICAMSWAINYTGWFRPFIVQTFFANCLGATGVGCALVLRLYMKLSGRETKSDPCKSASVSFMATSFYSFGRISSIKKNDARPKALFSIAGEPESLQPSRIEESNSSDDDGAEYSPRPIVEVQPTMLPKGRNSEGNNKVRISTEPPKAYGSFA